LASLESKALGAMDIFLQNTEEQSLPELHEIQSYWEEALTISESFNTLSLPPVLREIHKDIREYLNLQIKMCNLLRKKVAGNTKQYDEQITECRYAIEIITFDISEKQRKYE
jgi:hypothetical protein